MFDLEQYVRTVEKGISWDELQNKDLRIDDFHLVRMHSGLSGMFKDPRTSNVFVQFNFRYVFDYSKNLLTCPITRNVHTRLDFTPTDRSRNAGVYLGVFDFTMSQM